MFSPLEKSFLSLAFIPCSVLLVVLYWYAKRALVGESDTVAKRMEPWYAAMSGGMLGTFVFRLLPQAAGITDSPLAGWSYRSLSAFVMVGFYGLMWVDKFGRVWAYHAGTYAGLSKQEANELDTSHILDRKTMEITDYYEADDIQADAYPLELHQLQVETHIVTRRQRDAVLLFVLMMFIAIIEGLYLVYRQDAAPGGHAALVSCFYVDKLLETIVVSSILLHGDFHALPKGRKRIYWVFAALWSLTVLMSVVPVLSDAPLMDMTLVVRHPATSVFYAIASGLIFYISIYHIFVNRAHTDKREMLLRLVVFGAGLWIPFVTGMFI